jgi:hypothetical protein
MTRRSSIWISLSRNPFPGTPETGGGGPHPRMPVILAVTLIGWGLDLLTPCLSWNGTAS